MGRLLLRARLERLGTPLRIGFGDGLPWGLSLDRLEDNPS
jgi:hypothetical protein